MGTVPTGKMERELRALYLRWLAGVPAHTDDLPDYVARFEASSRKLIAREGGRTAMLGALADFPAPKLLELSPVATVVYDQMKQAGIQAGIVAGLNAKDVARQMLNAGLDKSYRRLERLARTETVSAYWKNQWDSVADLPDIVMVWGSEESKRTCDYCLSRDGLVVEDPNIRDHPNGRCTLIPTLRSQVKYKGTLQPDGSVDMDPRWTKQRVKGAKAQQAAGPATAEQLDPLSGKSNPAAPSKAQPVHQSAPKATAPATPEPKTVRLPDDGKTGYGSNARITEDAVRSGDWRYIQDREQRATVMLQNDYRAEQRVKAVAKNLQDGVDPFKGIDLDDPWVRNYTGVPSDLRYSDDPGVEFTLDDIKDHLQDAARWLVDQDEVPTSVLFKGLDVKEDVLSSLVPGAEFKTSFSSFSTDDSVAYRYTPSWSRVVVRVRGKSAVPIRDEANPSQFADGPGHKEHLVSGTGRITAVTREGSITWIDVEY